MDEEKKPVVRTGIIQTEISAEMKRAYLNYAMSVIVSRALPDVRDGLKPVHRRILFAMYKLGLTSSARYSKSAKVVGDVLGKYHPHGDAPVYDSLVRMAQEFSMRYPLIKGQGNFGSIDGDPPAAMRYTEVKLTKIAEEMLFDIDKETVAWIDNFDATLQEPVFLPAKLPNLLLMGAEGIAVGMATKIPPHNLTEVIDAIMTMLGAARKQNMVGEVPQGIKPSRTERADEPTSAKEDIEKMLFDTTLEELMEHVKGPDFPTAGHIYGGEEIKQAYATGRGKLLVRAKVDSEDLGKGRVAIIVDELPYQVNKANLVAKIADLVHEKKVVGISDLRDESDRDGIRVVIELKRDASYKKILNNLYKHTDLQTSYPVNMVVLVDGMPQTLSLKTILENYIRHRTQVIIARSEFELTQAKARAHILEGLLIALDNIDEVIDIIRKSANEPEAKTKLMKKFGLSDLQSQAILDMQLKRLTGLERSKIEEELKSLRDRIAFLEDLLKDIFKIYAVIKEELTYLKEKYGDVRRTKIFKNQPGKFSEEELIENKEVLITLTKQGYVKSVPKETFKVQNRGGKGVAGMDTHEEDDVYFITSAKTHDSILFFTNAGKVYQTRVWEIPPGSRIAKGKALINLINISPDEKVTSILTYNQAELKGNENSYILMSTVGGTVKKTLLADFANIRANGIIAIKLDKSDELMWVHISNSKMRVIMATKKGQSIAFDEGDVRSTGRSSQGVIGMRLEKGDIITSMDIFEKDSINNLLVLSENGIGKQSPLRLFPVQKRGGKGVKIASLDTRTGDIAFSGVVGAQFEALLITTQKGQVVKIPLDNIPKLSRSAKGVILMRFSKTDAKIAGATFV
ncbi:DNA gyrase subunit A [Candidatus Roizmanbacteria bacterium RIFCSPHIGHO2_02_FULL_40_13b]|uniref:DNA gyrase subunit A n=1 Tax=Candidatus Roizmanbacteria bacterium RIFCSPHIGHO2_01_FULL_39_24 TaxID=1802032 RepID=A0A1F7GEF4_9BACT|nr:MAG: DNA gyrase subunit A [Candidatus Roizmanbacteria bacterium RIFCSPHIGHO2_01_FULL_39_24]OGK27729.1 MAG: DNA gyrase subunit A [Candidatus Roizmanbacteria bacterium RIFCSPHIGHO2_02_FULL_40_13b]OGK49493.1 MAG: DNA gyrase subunit A [Candidatus Roizmanbacteria bacterium RIFCSPLOWO2_01_FULL_40_32]OGK56664.1 MAG: DNA gyrase subunit A [Candidatus Roizmanbacteria bacterium RIFCSPLOWO2_02_FULL_39_8]